MIQTQNYAAKIIESDHNTLLSEISRKSTETTPSKYFLDPIT